METQKTLNYQNNLEKNRDGGIILPNFKLYYKVTAIKTVWYWHKKQTHGPIEEKRKPRNKLTHLHSINLQWRGKNERCRKDSFLNKWR